MITRARSSIIAEFIAFNSAVKLFRVRSALDSIVGLLPFLPPGSSLVSIRRRHRRRLPSENIPNFETIRRRRDRRELKRSAVVVDAVIEHKQRDLTERGEGGGGRRGSSGFSAPDREAAQRSAHSFIDSSGLLVRAGACSSTRTTRLEHHQRRHQNHLISIENHQHHLMAAQSRLVPCH